MLRIYPPVTLHEIGQRANNEDAVYPEIPTEDDALFLVCDGVGGQEKGEIASQLICAAFSKFLSTSSLKRYSPADFLKAMKFVDERMAAHVKEHPETEGMASTCTAVALNRGQQSAVVGWVGDSRVYHIRNGQISFVTKDHSFVQDLVDNGEISEAEALIHPKRNVIMRSVNGSAQSRMDTALIHDLQTNDFLMLCTDGILENLGPAEILSYFDEHNTAEEIKHLMYENARDKTKDNFSMILLKVKDASQVNPLVPTAPASTEKQSGSLLKIAIIVVLIGLLWLLWYFYTLSKFY